MHRVVLLSVFFSRLLLPPPALAQSVSAPPTPEPVGRLRLTGFAHFDYAASSVVRESDQQCGEPLNEDRFCCAAPALGAL